MGNKLKIKLLRPPTVIAISANKRLPYGMGVISATLRGNGYEVDQDDLFVRVKDFNSNLRLFSNHIINLDIFSFNMRNERSCLNNGISEPPLNRLAEKLLHLTSYRYFNIISFSVHSYLEFLFTLLMAERIKQEINIPIILGGPFITLYAKLYFERYRFIDYMIVGDGRIPFLKLLSFLEGNAKIEDIPNLFYRKNGIVKTNLREYFNIEDIPLPDFEGLPLESYKQGSPEKELFLPYQISRGCSSNCSFCTFRKVDGVPTIKSPEKVVKELREYSIRYRSKYFFMCDTAFNDFYEQIEIICELLIQNRLDIHWEPFVKIDNLNERLLSKMRQAGCSLVRLGIESGSDRMLQLMNKGSTTEQASKELEICHRLGINTIVYLIVGYPYETKDDINRTIRFIEENKNYIQLFVLFRFRIGYGSLIYTNPKKFGVENLIEHSNVFIFDEINGLKYKHKRRQQTKTMLQILKTVYKDVLSERYHIGFITFYLFLLSEKIINNWFSRLLLKFTPQKILDVIYSLESDYFGGSLRRKYGIYGIYIHRYLFQFQRIRHIAPYLSTIFHPWSENDG